MVLCGTIKHHNKTSNQGFTALWHALELCKLMGYASSLSAKPADYFSGFYFYNKFPISISVSFLYICKVMIPYMIYSESM